ncbi:MAG: glycosyltransferase family 4 protein [Acidobacteria bacterium]|nr:glycosyltransferase family 4 protein [Acidobacteriota bacterium]MBV9070800.1 glycosyltransferase family 4 protein [Acidobacteriota bacterium]MBV9475334.1 glycosyltransferase family 4 protein [Acidobacteriota bacterium]
MKIYQILEFNQFNTGSVHQMFQAASGLRQRGHDVTIVSKPDAILAAKAAEQDIHFHGLPFRHQFDFATVRALRRLFRNAPPDVIHVHKGISHALALAATWRRPAGAFVVNRGVSFPLDLWNRGKYRTSRVDRVVTVCRQIKDVIGTSGRLPEEKVQVIYAGTDVMLFDPVRWDARAFRREKSIADDRFVVAQVGVRDWKGWKELIDSVSDVAPAHPNVHLLLIGCRNAQEKDEVLRYAREVGVEERVSAVEYRTDMPNVFASCDVVVDASWAGTGITGTIREAMAMGKPVIATDAGGNQELVSTSDVGWLVPMKDRAALTKALRAVIANPARAAEIGNAARQHVVKGFSKELRINRLEELYASILRSKR